MILRLPLSIINAPWYPRDRQFTECEARMDYMLCQGLLTPKEAAARWGWSEECAADLILVMNTGMDMPPKKDLYEKEDDAKKVAADVVLLFNQIFECKIGVSTKRVRQVTAILKEGKKMGDPVTMRQFRAVFEFKKAEWTGTDQEKFLRFETLCSDKFIGYLDAARIAYKKKMQPKPDEGIRLSGSIVR